MEKENGKWFFLLCPVEISLLNGFRSFIIRRSIAGSSREVRSSEPVVK